MILNQTIYGLLALLPIVLCGIFLIGLQWSAKKNNADNFSGYCDACYFIWGMTLTRVSSSIIQGLVITVSVWWIVFGVIFLLNKSIRMPLQSFVLDLLTYRQIDVFKPLLLLGALVPLLKARLVSVHLPLCRPFTASNRLSGAGCSVNGHDDTKYTSILCCQKGVFSAKNNVGL